MPEALATIKRKFYKLLDPPSPSTSLHRPPTNTSVAESAREPTAKRIRSDEASPSAIILARIQARNASTTSVASKASTASSSKPAVPPKDPPNFLPWSHEGFLKRLKTFSPVTMWHPKPDAVNEVEWAKRGWSCVDTNTVACRGGCEKRVVVKLEPFARRPGAGSDEDEGEEGEEGKGMGEEEDDEYDEQLEHSLVERYRALIVNGHAEGCLWQQAGCKSDIYRLPVVRSTVWQPELKSRYASLVAISRSFRNVDLKPKDATPPPEKLLRDFPATLLTSPTNDIPPPSTSDDEEAPEPAREEPTREVQCKALLISLCGWRGIVDSHTHLLSCDACFQRIGLWMYQPDYKRLGSSSSDSALNEDQSLDLVEMHREHCPWRNGTTQAATGEYAKSPAWEILYRVVARYADEQRRRSRGRTYAPVEVERPRSSEGVVGVVEGGEGGDVVDGLVEEPAQELSREEIARQDKERSTKLRRLKTVLGMKRKPVARPASEAAS